MSEKQKEIMKSLAEKLPNMSEHERGYLEGTIATAVAMSKKKRSDTDEKGDRRMP